MSEEVEELETLQYSLMSSPGLQMSVRAAEEANVLAKKAEDKAIEGAMSEEEVEELETLQYSLMSSPGLQMSVKAAEEANVLAKKAEDKAIEGPMRQTCWQRRGSRSGGINQ